MNDQLLSNAQLGAGILHVSKYLYGLAYKLRVYDSVLVVWQLMDGTFCLDIESTDGEILECIETDNIDESGFDAGFSTARDALDYGLAILMRATDNKADASSMKIERLIERLIEHQGHDSQIIELSLDGTRIGLAANWDFGTMLFNLTIISVGGKELPFEDQNEFIVYESEFAESNPNVSISFGIATLTEKCQNFLDMWLSYEYDTIINGVQESHCVVWTI